jgi:hypothetical protein
MIEHDLLAMANANQNPAMGKTEVISAACAALSDGGTAQAVSMLTLHYPFAPQPVSKRRYGPIESTRVFIRDGFIDRYSGERLIYPPVFVYSPRSCPKRFRIIRIGRLTLHTQLIGKSPPQ